jgi:hypothetical protein
MDNCNSFLSNTRTQQWNNGVMQPSSRQWRGKHTYVQARWRHTPTVLSCHVTCFLCGLRYATVEMCFLCCPCRGYTYNTNPLRVQESFSSVPRFHGDWIRNSKKTLLWSEVLVSLLRSVARRWLVKTENLVHVQRWTVNCVYQRNHFNKRD